MEPATSIILKLGGAEAASKLIGVHRTRVFSWMRAREEGGTGGVVPQRHFAKILSIAAERHLEITAESLICAPTPNSERAA